MSQVGAPPETEFGPFVLERRIAVGGSSEVFLARPRRGNQPAPRLVIKRPHPTNTPQGEYQLLEREAQLHRAVIHPNVVTVYSAGIVNGQPYLAMEYVEGVDLYRLLRFAQSEGNRLPLATAVYIARRVALALSSVHEAVSGDGTPLHIVHRDVTPSNVYLSVNGDVKLGDFGIARGHDHAPQSKQQEGLKGKFGYLAPEQVSGLPFDHRADLFSLSAMFGEVLIGERVFPGSGQLAVLLAIRDANIEPLERMRHEFPPPVFQILRRGLARDPERRYRSAAELASALLPFEQPGHEALRREVGDWVRRAFDSAQIARKLEGQIRDSMRRMRAVQRVTTVDSNARPTQPPPAGGLSEVRRKNGEVHREVEFARLVEWVASGQLDGDDEVALMGAPLQPIREIDALARHVLPSSTATTGHMFQPGVPDFQASLEDNSMLSVLARLRERHETGGLFIERADAALGSRRKEIYVRDGRLLHVASNDRAELLGEYLVRRGVLERQQLELALKRITLTGGRLGDTLIGLGVVDAMDVFHAIRDQGRDRVATLCSWPRGKVTFYRGSAPTRVDFPLDLDLTSPMMAGIIIRAQGDPAVMLPSDDTHLQPGPRADVANDAQERGTAPSSLQMIATLIPLKLTVAEMRLTLTAPRPGTEARQVSDKEACAAMLAARLLGWLDFESPITGQPALPSGS